jgi:hypothetical protein
MDGTERMDKLGVRVVSNATTGVSRLSQLLVVERSWVKMEDRGSI